MAAKTCSSLNYTCLPGFVGSPWESEWEGEEEKTDGAGKQRNIITRHKSGEFNSYLLEKLMCKFSKIYIDSSVQLPGCSFFAHR